MNTANECEDAYIEHILLLIILVKYTTFKRWISLSPEYGVQNYFALSDRFESSVQLFEL